MGMGLKIGQLSWSSGSPGLVAHSRNPVTSPASQSSPALKKTVELVGVLATQPLGSPSVISPSGPATSISSLVLPGADGAAGVVPAGWLRTTWSDRPTKMNTAAATATTAAATTMSNCRELSATIDPWIS
jgi:hypothetical protein